jgi:type IV secretion system protein VirD4
MGVMQDITNRLTIFTTQRVYELFKPSKNQLRWKEDVETHNIFIDVPEDKLEQYSPVLTMICTQLIRTLERRSEKYSPEGEKMRPILLMLDEFPRLGKMEVIASALSTLRSKDVTICIVFQSLAQLDAIYGCEVRRVILDNCSYKAICHVGDAETQKYFSDLCGMVKVEGTSRTTSYDAKTRRPTGYSDHESISYEPLIRPHEFATLKDIVLLTPDGFHRVKKVPYHEMVNKEPSIVIKITEKISEVASKVRSFAGGIMDKIKGFFGRKRRDSYV